MLSAGGGEEEEGWREGDIMTEEFFLLAKTTWSLLVQLRSGQTKSSFTMIWSLLTEKV
jgi:hypothetical protein